MHLVSIFPITVLALPPRPVGERSEYRGSGRLSPEMIKRRAKALVWAPPPDSRSSLLSLPYNVTGGFHGIGSFDRMPTLARRKTSTRYAKVAVGCSRRTRSNWPQSSTRYPPPTSTGKWYRPRLLAPLTEILVFRLVASPRPDHARGGTCRVLDEKKKMNGTRVDSSLSGDT